MARGRIIDKAFFSNYQVNRLSLPAKFLYIGTIVFADDEGRFRAEPRLLSSQIHPIRCSLGGPSVITQLKELVQSKLIVIYKVNGEQFGYHPNWLKWQPLRKDRIKTSDCPPPPNWQPNDNQVSTTCPQIGTITGTGTGTEPKEGRIINNIPPSTTDFSSQKPEAEKLHLKDLIFHKIFSAITTAQKTKYLEKYPADFLQGALTRYIETGKDKKISVMKASTVYEFLEKDYREYQKASGEPDRRRREKEQAEKERLERDRIAKEPPAGKSLKTMFEETLKSKNGGKKNDK